MAKKRANRSKRSLSSLPKGLVRRGGVSDPGNPFEVTARQNKRPKHEVHNRPLAKPKSTKHTLENLQRRKHLLRQTIHSSKKANVFVDKRIGQYDPTMSRDDQMLRRLVKERSRQSHRMNKYRLGDDGSDNEEMFLTHKGKRLDPNKTEVLYSDDEDKGGQLEAVDTELHFGGSGLAGMKQVNPYGSSVAPSDLAQVYGQRKTELDDLIARRRMMKAEKMQAKEAQVETVDKLDDDFAEISALLRYRKNEKRPVVKEVTQEDKEMNEWNLEMKQMMMRPKRKATDRTKTPEEIAKEEAEKLEELEHRRMARMNGDFEEDDFSDISVDEHQYKKRGKKKSLKTKKAKKERAARNPDELSDSDSSEDEDKLEARFTADGLKYFDKEGNIVDPDKRDANDDDSEDFSESDDDDDEIHPLEEGTRVRASYRAAEQFDGHEAWYEGVIEKVHKQSDGSVRYDIQYGDGDFEESVIPKNVRAMEKTEEEKAATAEKQDEDLELKFKRHKARDKARKEIPYILEVPTTLEFLHETIARYANTGKDASTIVERIHKANSVRLDHRNTEKMQNFYDVILRRFVAVGDAIFDSGDGGEELGRYDQLNALTRVMYAMAHDAPESAGAVWSRRIGIFQNAHAKRLRDAEFIYEEEEDSDELQTAWPSTGTFLLLRAMGHIFPVTDRRHYVVSPAILLLGQMVAQTPVTSAYDLMMGVLCSGLLMEYNKEAKRVVPEALGFLAGTLKLYSIDPGSFALPTLEASYNEPAIATLRQSVLGMKKSELSELPRLQLERAFCSDNTQDSAVAILSATLDLVTSYTSALTGSFSLPVETELLAEVSESILCLRPRSLPKVLQTKLVETATVLANVCDSARLPMQRRESVSSNRPAIKSLAPRMEDPERYTFSKDKGKKALQAALDRTRREYKREKKAVSRELRIDAAMVEQERRSQYDKNQAKEKAKRNKNFAWLEGEQAAMNQQVRMGGGLLRGGGMGAARAKASSNKLGIKKGGKF